MTPLPPITLELSYEQQFSMRAFEDQIKKLKKDELIDLMISLQTHNYVLKNTISSLVKGWPD